MTFYDDLDFGTGPRLWDADPDVCCAAFQLGACVHTEGTGDGEEAVLAEDAEQAALDDAAAFEAAWLDTQAEIDALLPF